MRLTKAETLGSGLLYQLWFQGVYEWIGFCPDQFDDSSYSIWLS